MNLLLKTISYLGLALTIFPSVLVLAGELEFPGHYNWTLAGSVLWFATAPFWIGRKRKHRSL